MDGRTADRGARATTCAARACAPPVPDGRTAPAAQRRPPTTATLPGGRRAASTASPAPIRYRADSSSAAGPPPLLHSDNSVSDRLASGNPWRATAPMCVLGGGAPSLLRPIPYARCDFFLGALPARPRAVPGAPSNHRQGGAHSCCSAARLVAHEPIDNIEAACIDPRLAWRSQNGRSRSTPQRQCTSSALFASCPPAIGRRCVTIPGHKSPLLRKASTSAFNKNIVDAMDT